MFLSEGACNGRTWGRDEVNPAGGGKCKEHEPQILEVTEGGHTYHVNGDVCSKCGELL